MQRVGIRQSVSAAPLQPGALVLDHSANFSPEKYIAMSMLKQRAVERQVQKEQKEVFLPLLKGIVLDSKEGSMERLAAEMDFERLINLHNSSDRPLDAHEPVCIGSQFDKGVRFMALTTPHLLDNMVCANNCWWQL